MKFKIFVIGLDGATFDLIKPWAEEGKLPTFQRLFEQGTAGELKTTIPPMTAPAWTTFMTGKNPGKHGLYDWIYRHKDSYNVSPVTAAHCKEPALWELLSNSGKKVCIFNIPMTFPPKPVNGLVISGLPAPSTEVTITYPKDLLEEIEAEVGEYLLYPDPGQAYSDAGVDAFLDRLYKTTKMRLKVMSYLRAHDEWDFFMMVFNGTDTIQHAMWKYMSPEHPLHDPDKYSKYGDSILNYFRYIDYELGKITDELGENEVLVLMSDHGFGPFHKFIHVNNWLRKQGWLKIKRSPLATVKTILFDLGFAPMKIYNLLMRMGLGSLKREVVRGQGQGLLKKLFLSFDDVDWFRTAAYSLGNVGQISLNVRGREPHGLIEPGKPYEDLRDEIITRLWQFRDPETGEKVVQEVYRREEIYRGDYVGEASDIIFIPTRMEYFGFGEYEFGSNETIESMKRGISGTHRPYGMFLMYGKPIKQGVWYSGANILDLVPTILFLMSKTVPSDMDGRVLSELIDPELFEILEKGKTETRQTATDKRPENGPPSVDSGLSEEEQQIIAKRLRDLGYVG